MKEKRKALHLKYEQEIIHFLCIVNELVTFCNRKEISSYFWFF